MKAQETKSDRKNEAKKRAKETLDILEHGFTTTKRIHPGYQEYENAKKKGNDLFKKYKIKRHFGKWQYFFERGNLIVSLIKFRGISDWIWEMYNDDKKLFTDCKRFATKKEAMKEIENLLGE